MAVEVLPSCNSYFSKIRITKQVLYVHVWIIMTDLQMGISSLQLISVLTDTVLLRWFFSSVLLCLMFPLLVCDVLLLPFEARTILCNCSSCLKLFCFMKSISNLMFYPAFVNLRVSQDLPTIIRVQNQNCYIVSSRVFDTDSAIFIEC